MEASQLKLDKLEAATLHLVEQVSRLSEMIGEMSELRREQHMLSQNQVATDSKAQIAMVNALAVQDDVNQMAPRLDSLIHSAAFDGEHRRRRWYNIVAFFVITSMVTTYAAISGYQSYVDTCIRVSFLSETKAAICDNVLYGDVEITPGPQYSQRLSRESFAPLTGG